MFLLKNLDLDLCLFTLQLHQLIFSNQVTLGIAKDCSKNSTTEDCQHGLTYFPEIGMCIGVFDDNPTGWWSAKKACRNKYSAEQVEIENTVMEKFIQDIIPVSNKKHWIGLSIAQLKLAVRSKKTSRLKNDYSNWKGNFVLEDAAFGACVVRNAADGLWETAPCSARLGYICYQKSTIPRFIKVELEMVKGYSPPNTVYPREDAHFKCRATTSQRGKVVLRLQYARKATANVTSEYIKSLRANFNEETTWSNTDCTKKTAIDLSFYVNTTLKILPTFQCCLMVFSLTVNCSLKLSPKVQYPDPIRPTLIVGYHNPPPTIYHGLKLRATCATNGGVIVWALKTHNDTIIWKEDQTGQIVAHPSYNEIVEDVEIKLLESHMDLIFGFVINSSFSVEVKPILNNSVLSCYSHTIQYPNQVKNVHDDLRAASEAFRYEIYYKPQEIKAKVGTHQGRNVVFMGRKFNASCAAAVGSHGLMTFSIRQNNHLSMWKIDANGTKTFLNQEIRFLYRINFEFVKNMLGAFIKINITASVKKSMKGTVISCQTRGIKYPLNTNKFWNQERKSSSLLVYEPPCSDPEVEGTRLLYRTVAREDNTLVYYSCNETKLIPSPKWPVQCRRNPENGSLIWNATLPICIPRPLLVSRYFWFKWMTITSFIIGVIILLIVPYNCERGSRESHTEDLKMSPESQYDDQEQEGIYIVQPTVPEITVVNA